MEERHRERGLSLVEILVATLVVAITVVVHLGLASQEVGWTRDIADRAKALALAQNMLALIEYGYRDELEKGTVAAGDYVLANADQVLADGHLAIGTGLFDWVADKRGAGGFNLSLRWTPTPLDAGGNPVACVGRATCRVEWLSHDGKARSLECSRILTH